METIEILNGSYRFEEWEEVQVWTNGTRLHLARHYYYNHPDCLEAWINETTWLSMNSIETQIVSPLTITGRLPEIWNESSDWMYFLAHASNGTHFTSYAHDNNYERYYPYDWDLNYNLKGAAYKHIHLGSSTINSWICGNLSTAAIVALDFFVGNVVDFCVEELVTMGLEALGVSVAAVLESPLIVAISTLLAIKDYIEFMAKEVGYISTAAWVHSVVKEHFGGDGWSWMGPIVTLVGDIAVRNFYYLCPITDWRHFEARFWNKTWGSQGIFCRNEICALWYTRQEVKVASSVYEPSYSRAGRGPFP
ncbi:hypothetical protein KEJ15_03820 [Candidatus Bathyarchaeota archaeon]|nr:hypothetical protein [Candidatus Bathyarchaeota archaeon]